MTAATLSATVTFPDGLPVGSPGPAGPPGPQGPAGTGGGGTGSGYSQRLKVYRADKKNSAFKKGTLNTLYLRAGVEIEYLGALYAPTTDQPVTGPTLVPGSDYRVFIKSDGSLQYDLYSVALPSGAAVMGGFHMLPGSPAAGLDTGGGWTPTLLEWSIWDVTFRPKCDPRGMTRIGSAGFWVDIYFHGTNSNTAGVSGNDDTIMSGSNWPLIPADFGGDGTTKFTQLTWWIANEHLRGWGKRLPSYEEMCLAAFGTNEGDGRGLHPVKTGLGTFNTPPNSDPNFTSKFGLIQATGCMWIWTSTLSDWQGTAAPADPGFDCYDVTGGRGKLILQNSADLTALLFGGSSVYTSTSSPTANYGANYLGVAGSRCAETIEKLWDNSSNIAMRGACDHTSR